MKDDGWMDNLPEDPKLAGKHKPAPVLQSQVSVAQAEKAASGGDKDGRYHGSYRQVTMRLRPEVVREVEEWVRRLGTTNAALQRYIVWRGLQALKDGERPEMQPTTEMREY